MESNARATEKKQRGCHRLPGSGPGRLRGRTHSSRASPGVRLWSWLARPRPGVRAGRGFPQAPSPSAKLLETCLTNLVSGGAKERRSGQKVRAVEAAPWRRTPGRREQLVLPGTPLGQPREGGKLRELGAGGGSPSVWDTGVGGRKPTGQRWGQPEAWGWLESFLGNLPSGVAFGSGRLGSCNFFFFNWQHVKPGVKGPVLGFPQRHDGRTR